MDDLDHSIHISEDDWSSFYEESEECCLLQPVLAFPDHSCLSDSEDSGNSSPVFITGPQEPQQGSDASCDTAESNAAPWCMREMQIYLSNSRKEQDDPSTKAKEDRDTQVNCEIGLDCPEGNSTNIEELHLVWSVEHTTEEVNDDITGTLQTEQINSQSTHGEAVELKKDNEVLQTGSDTCELKPVQKPDPLSCHQTEVIVNEPHSTDRAEGKDVSSVVALRAERERWFVTVNDSPAQQRVQRSSGKKKRRQKKNKDGLMCRSGKQENSKGFKPEGNRDGDDLKRGGGISDSCQIIEENPETIPAGVVSDSSQVSSTSCEEDNLPEGSISSHSSRDNFTLYDEFTFKGPPRMDSVESEDGAEFFSTHSYDSESYLSASESMDEPQYLLINNPSLQSSGSLTKNSCLLNLMENTNANNTQVTEIPLYDNALFSNSTAASSKGYKSSDVKPTQTLPFVGQSVNNMPDDNSACANHNPSELPCISSNPSGVQKHEVNLPASACSSGDQLSLLSVPDLTVTPSLVADTPDTYAEAMGNTQPVYAISAFWDEMEKLTINDILQLRMGRSPAPRETHETSTPNDDSLTNPSSLDETVDSLCSGGSTDPDTADSDYFTQADDTKPDRSSCEFSTSDFEEEYWQFLGASRNTSPELQGKFQSGTKDSPYFEEEESTCSEGKETPVPLEDCAGHLFQDQDTKASNSSELVWPRQITKSKSVHNVPALIEDSSLQLILGHDDSSLFSSSCPSLVEDVVLEASGSLGKLMQTVCLSNTQLLDDLLQMPISEVFEDTLKDQIKRERCITLFDPEDFSTVPVFHYTPCILRDETSLSIFHDSQCSDRELIPIFSCSQPTIRELTLPNPNYVFLSSDYKEARDVSPIRIVSHSLIQSKDLGTSARAFSGFPSLLSIRRIRLQSKGSIWCGSSGAWVFPFEALDNTIKIEDPPLTLIAKRSVPTTSSQLLRELAEQQTILGTFQTTRREGIFSTLKQSDMCLVCIAFASWVLRSSDPEAADAWKAALLANVSALSAIQYLRQYLKKKPSQNDP